MNVDGGKESFTGEEIAELQRRVIKYKEDNGFGWSGVGLKMGIPNGTISQFAPGTYKGDMAAIAAKVHRFFLHAEVQDELARDAPIAPGFQATKTAKRVMGTLAWGQRGKFVAVVGDPGTGKTAALKQYQVANPNVWMMTASPSRACINSMLLALVQAMGAKARQFGRSHALAALAREKVEGRRGLIIVDEAQHLAAESLEELRVLHDETGVGLALVGNREVLTRVEGAAREAAFAQLYSRMSLRLVLPAPAAADVDVLLNAWEISDARQRDFLSRIALKPGGGGVRSLTATLEYATVMAQQADDEPRVLDHLKDAWTALSSRSAAA